MSTKKTAWESYTKAQEKEMESLCKDYRDFLDVGKTERECVRESIRLAEAAGYKPLSKARKADLVPGAKVYCVCMNKTIVLFKLGSDPVEDGLNILGAHIDSPRLDIKQNPLYEKEGVAYLDTHYYGGIKNYQWVTLPLALHGVICKKDGTTVEVNLGESEDEPVLFISDLLPHLDRKHMAEKKAEDFIGGETLDLIVGSRPVVIKGDSKEDDKDTVKKYILQVLKKTYDMEEDDFLSAEIEVVPAGHAREAGLDRSMVLAYGQDDRICAYTSLRALLDIGDVKRTACCILVDKEEIGSVGATGMESHFFENSVAELLDAMGVKGDLAVRRCLSSSFMLSSDVSAAYDPTFASSFDKKNAAIMGNGMVFNKFTGRGGKSGSNDANAEYVAKIRNILDTDKVRFQTAELGKVDEGGGGTIAYILALYGMNVIDSGVAILSMHAPWEAASKADIYETYKGYKSFVERA